MTVTKQQQLGWLAKNCESWPVMSEFIVMHSANIGVCGSCWEITLEEWQRERNKMQKQAERTAQSAQDNSWHERGELPPVGVPVELWVGGLFAYNCEFITRRRHHYVMWNLDADRPDASDYMNSEFRPLRTEREKAIDAACDVICKKGVNDFERGVITKLYDAGMLK